MALCVLRQSSKEVNCQHEENDPLGEAVYSHTAPGNAGRRTGKVSMAGPQCQLRNGLEEYERVEAEGKSRYIQYLRIHGKGRAGEGKEPLRALLRAEYIK